MLKLREPEFGLWVIVCQSLCKSSLANLQILSSTVFTGESLFLASFMLIITNFINNVSVADQRRGSPVVLSGGWGVPCFLPSFRVKSHLEHLKVPGCTLALLIRNVALSVLKYFKVNYSCHYTLTCRDICPFFFLPHCSLYRFWGILCIIKKVHESPKKKSHSSGGQYLDADYNFSSFPLT